MTAIQLLACAGMIVGVFFAGNEASGVYGQPVWISIESKTKSAEDIRESSGRKKSGILRRELEEAQNILQMTGRGNRFSIICAVALALFCAGDPLLFCWEFFPCSGDGSGFFISTILVCETDCQSL